jgi:hypothetical protein
MLAQVQGDIRCAADAKQQGKPLQVAEAAHAISGPVQQQRRQGQGPQSQANRHLGDQQGT